MPTWEECSKRPDKIDRMAICKKLWDTVNIGQLNLPKKQPYPSETKRKIAEQLRSVLKNEFGPWVTLWSYSQADGGFVQSWCCPNHSILIDKETCLSSTIDRVADAVCQWHASIIHFETLFDQLTAESIEESESKRLENAAVVLVNEVLKFNGGNESWYAAFSMVFGWYLESQGFLSQSIEDCLLDIIDGHFESWTVPSDQEISIAAQHIVEGSKQLKRVTEIDSTEQWLNLRTSIPLLESEFRPKTTVAEDQHLKFIQEFDRKKSNDRAEKMIHALKKCRMDAENGVTFDWQLISTWQGLVLGKPANFRTGDAFAKNGQERYPLRNNTPELFNFYLKQVNEPICPIRNAARTYMDICCFHPFEDGNARAARLALEFILSRNDLALILPEPIFLFSRPADSNRLEAALFNVVGKRGF